MMNLRIKLLAHKTRDYILLEYLLKYKDMKEVVLEMDIITTSSTPEIIRHNTRQMSF